PALFEAPAAAVLFHEVLGHRLEGQRQRDDQVAQALARQIGRPLLPRFLSVYDDPTLAALGDTALAGSYRIDDEGVPARRVGLVKD
ncbi:metallopeptidase TldD-related protein, partial [Escherichia coli]